MTSEYCPQRASIILVHNECSIHEQNEFRTKKLSRVSSTVTTDKMHACSITHSEVTEDSRTEEGFLVLSRSPLAIGKWQEGFQPGARNKTTGPKCDHLW